MQQLSDGTLVLSATDLTNHLACGHLTQQRLGVVRGERPRPQHSESAHADLLRRRGDEHEAAELVKLIEAAGGDWAELPSVRRQDEDGKYLPPTRELLEEAAAATAAAMQAGTRLLYQASFFDGRWQGSTDFLRRVDLADVRDERTRKLIEQSTLGDYAYEVLDTKLSKAVKPHVVHQLLLYSRLIGRLQGVELPLAWVIRGDGAHESVELGKYGALHRRVVGRFEAVADAPTQQTYPEPVAHCPICSLSQECSRRLRADDHLSLVANARRGQREQLVGLGLPTVASLAGAAADVDAGKLDVGALGADRFSTLHHQARLQLVKRETGALERRHLPPVRAAGYALLPEPNPGDVFFDLEGDPYIGEGGIEYLWGWSFVGAAASPAVAGYDCVWAHDEAEEQAALERFVDFVIARRREFPGLHVFHYAAHERSKLLGLALKYATREAEVDALVREGVLVDLYAVVTRALQVGEESYSLKKLEEHHGFRRLETSVREGGGSIVAYEGWIETGEDDLLESIRAYNEEDCRSTESLRDWLQHELLPEAEAKLGVRFSELRDPEPDPDALNDPPWVAEIEALTAALHSGLQAPVAGETLRPDDTADEAERRLAGHLLLYHRREGKPEWWRHFELRAMGPQELIEQRDALGAIVRDESVEPVWPGGRSQSFDYAFAFPPQEFKKPMKLIDPVSGDTMNLESIDHAAGRLVLRRSKKRDGDPWPVALTPGSPVDAKVLRGALVEIGESVLAGDGRFGPVRRLLRREPPAVAFGESTEQLIDAALVLGNSVGPADGSGSRGGVLAVQGPPGTGKTYSAARMIVAALAAGKRVGITAQSHAAVQNVLRAVEEHATEAGVADPRATSWRGIYKGKDAGDEAGGYEGSSGLVETVDDNKPVEAAVESGSVQLVAGTSWLFGRPVLREWLDLLFVDEAGQLALATTAAAGTSAREGIVLLGDPQQLPQVTQAEHPGGSGASVLEHWLGGEATIAEDRGVLLTQTWRMHPDVCEFVSAHSYDGRLHAEADCARRAITLTGVGEAGSDALAEGAVLTGGSLHGAGVRALAVGHEGRAQRSPEEALVIAAACRRLLDGGSVSEPLRDAPAAVRRAITAGDELPEGTMYVDGIVRRLLVPNDLLVVAPYNLAVQEIQAAVPAGVRVGTVDKIQGQEAPVVFYALTCSSAEDVPRGLDFLFDANRLNVAVSRAQCLAVLVHSPRLLDADCRTLEAMRLADGVCRLVEAAG